MHVRVRERARMRAYVRVCTHLNGIFERSVDTGLLCKVKGGLLVRLSLLAFDLASLYGRTRVHAWARAHA